MTCREHSATNKAHWKENAHRCGYKKLGYFSRLLHFPSKILDFPVKQIGLSFRHNETNAPMLINIVNVTLVNCKVRHKKMRNNQSPPFYQSLCGEQIRTNKRFKHIENIFFG